jgi:hypothetical protein
MGVVLQLEYVPNSMYSFAMVKTILKDYTDVKVKGSRFWENQIVRGVASKILYTLHDYCPGMPVNLEQVATRGGTAGYCYYRSSTVTFTGILGCDLLVQISTLFS